MITLTKRLTFASKESNLGLKLSAYRGFSDDKVVTEVEIKLYPNHSSSDLYIKTSLNRSGLDELVSALQQFKTEVDKHNEQAAILEETKASLRSSE